MQLGCIYVQSFYHLIYCKQVCYLRSQFKCSLILCEYVRKTTAFLVIISLCIFYSEEQIPLSSSETDYKPIPIDIFHNGTYFVGLLTVSAILSLRQSRTLRSTNLSLLLLDYSRDIIVVCVVHPVK